MDNRINLGRAFTYAFDDPNSTTKLVITAIIGIIPIANLAVVGWALDLVRNMLEGEAHPMPDWDTSNIADQFVQRWIAGLVVAIAYFVYLLPMTIIEAGVNGGAAAMFDGNNVGAGFALTGLSCIMGLVAAAYGAAVFIPFSVAVLRYATTRDYSHFLNISQNIQLARQHLSTLIVLAVLVFVARFLLGIIFLVPCIGWLLALFGITISAVVIAHLLGQAGQVIAAERG